MGYRHTIAVGGPLAGKILPLREECGHLSVAVWSKPRVMLQAFLLDRVDLRSLTYDLQEYRWKEVVVGTGYFECRCCALVHESFSEGKDIHRAVVGFALAHLLTEGISH